MRPIIPYAVDTGKKLLPVKMYLLDTNACIRILRGSSATLVERVSQHAPQEICLCSIVKAELVYGAYRSARPAENMRLRCV